MSTLRIEPSARGFPASCPHCNVALDLLESPWCGCTADHPSKICQRCWQCACSHFDYKNPLCWESPPKILRENGFDRLFSPYLRNTTQPAISDR